MVTLKFPADLLTRSPTVWKKSLANFLRHYSYFNLIIDTSRKRSPGQNAFDQRLSYFYVFLII
jgi:hypothetical protein